MTVEQLKRQHSAEPLDNGVGPEGRKPSKSATPSAASTPKMTSDLSTTPPPLPGFSAPPPQKTAVDGPADDGSVVGSPMKRHRASLAGPETDIIKGRLGTGMTANIGEVFGSAQVLQGQSVPMTDGGMHHFGAAIVKRQPEDEEL